MILVLAIGCGGGTGGGDAGRDAGRSDAGRDIDAGGERDSGAEPDAGDVDAGEPDAGAVDGGEVDGGEVDAGSNDAGTDASVPTPDAGPPVDGGPPGSCHERLGAPCADSSECGAGFECAIGRCRPQSREICGGFAGAPCTMPPYTECLYYSSADFGACLTPAERDCLCRRYPSAFSCP